MSAVIRSMNWASGDTVLMFDFNYGAVKMAVEQLGGPVGVEVVIVPFPTQIGGSSTWFLFFSSCVFVLFCFFVFFFCFFFVFF